MTPRTCTDGTLRHLSVDLDLDDTGGGDGGSVGYTLCSAPERPVWGRDQESVDMAFENFRTESAVDIAALPACEECSRVAELLAGPDAVPPLHRRPPRPEFASGFSGDEIRAVLRTDIATGATPGRSAGVHLLSFTTMPDQPGFGDHVKIFDLVWDDGDIVRMGQVTDWAAVVAFAAAADVPDRDRKLIALAASLDSGPLPAVLHTEDPEAARRVLEAIAIVTGHGDRWDLTERPRA
ncbi:hypothetical protein [Actinoplanes couchii]|uniref:SnoaL-like domain-containing protein n=1 Tax=Actinoplanes couchii TaxID=403638 RepID=A0ABQ3XLQ9_9ACTN|nr:hypothetical protein [Actinoplanes couchii]MDR6318291.1 hypothetical protein [Actinoplanes couchii]GID59340.1 hypothetical protein Aco03nite_077440 [Actinoplanes couchii]